MNLYGRRGPLVRLAFLAAALATWVLTGFGRLSRVRVVTLCYHGVTPHQAALFARQMSALAGHTLATCHLPEAARGARRGTPPRVCVTFDDGFANLLDNALPLTRRLGIPVTIFAVTGNLGHPPRWALAPHHPDSAEPTMTAEQLATAALDPLCTIGSHTVTHRDLTRLRSDELASELAGSRAALESILNRPVEDFAFPYGAVDRRVIEAALAAGYRRVYTLDPYPSPPGHDGRIVSRMLMTPDVWPIEFRLTVAGAYSWIAPLKGWLRRDRGPAERLPAQVA
jgi:peptidoglycan/xylan/chitin deacetylase (PgdA/CDA1 family)